jgi:hypothetical protein
MNQSTRARLEASDCSPDARGLSRSDGDCFESKLAGRPANVHEVDRLDGWGESRLLGHALGKAAGWRLKPSGT